MKDSSLAFPSVSDRWFFIDFVELTFLHFFRKLLISYSRSTKNILKFYFIFCFVLTYS